MKICELKINNGADRMSIIAILASAGYKVSIDKRNEEPPSYYESKEYFVIVETKEVESEITNS